MATDHSNVRFRTFDDLIDAFFDDPEVEAELLRRYETRAAVLVTDFTSMVRRTDAEGIAYALALARAAERAMEPAITAHGGEIVKRVADTFMAVFKTAPGALSAALDSAAAMREFNKDRTGHIGDGSRNDPIHPCIGLGWGDILVIPGTDIYGEEANRAFVLGEDVAAGREILATTRFVEVLSPLPQGVGSHRAPEEREAECGFAFHILSDHR